MARVTAPNRGYSGISAGVQFKDGVGETDNPAALAYFRQAGYGIDGDPPVPQAPPEADARAHTGPEAIGTRLRDAAVDPRASDFLPPTNAGEADPHGPRVVAPGIHAHETGPIVPGPVPRGNQAQEEKETAVDQAVFVEQLDVADVVGGTRPTQSARKAEWVDFAVARGMRRRDAEALTVAEIQDRYPEGG